jgi:alpha-1,2-mannosyltransferase
VLLASPRTTRTWPRTSAGRSRAALAGGAALAVALAACLAEVLAHPLHETLTWFDLRVYAAAGRTAVHSPAMLYTWQMVPGFRFTYTPFAAVLFAAWAWVPWGVLTWLMTAGSAAALGMAVWFTLGGLGWRGRGQQSVGAGKAERRRRLGGTLAVTAAALWTEPVQRALHLGQVELLLMALVIWDLCQPGRRWWRGAGVGLAAGIKLVPLIFIPYLALTRQYRQAATAAVTFAILAAAGFTVLPQASWQWWFGADFLRAERTGFVGFLANQSLRGMFTRTSGSLAGGLWWWLAAAALAGVAGLVTAARLHRAGRPVHGWLTCALTGLLVSPVSWDHHWVWVAPGLAVLADAAVRARRGARWACWALGGAVAVVFGAWPMVGRPGPLVPWGLIWYAPGSPGTAGSHPWSSEYHWHGLTWLAGNLYTLAGLALLAGLAVLARGDDPPGTPRWPQDPVTPSRRLGRWPGRERQVSGSEAPFPSWSTRLVPLPPAGTGRSAAAPTAAPAAGCPAPRR